LEENLNAQLDLNQEANRFAENLVRKQQTVEHEMQGLEKQVSHLKMLSQTLQDEQKMLLDRGKLAEKLLNLELGDIDNDWLHQQLRAYKKEIHTQKHIREKYDHLMDQEMVREITLQYDDRMDQEMVRGERQRGSLSQDSSEV
jgi:hypothetical protein